MSPPPRMSHLKQFLTRCYLMYMLYFYGALEHYSGAMTRAAGESPVGAAPRCARRSGCGPGAGDLGDPRRGRGGRGAPGSRGGRERPLSRALTTTDSPGLRRTDDGRRVRPGGFTALEGRRRSTYVVSHSGTPCDVASVDAAGASVAASASSARRFCRRRSCCRSFEPAPRLLSAHPAGTRPRFLLSAGVLAAAAAAVKVAAAGAGLLAISSWVPAACSP